MNSCLQAKTTVSPKKSQNRESRMNKKIKARTTRHAEPRIMLDQMTIDNHES